MKTQPIHSGVVLATLVIAGCTNIGPQTVPRDRFDYNTAVSDSWKEQTLLNIVKIRYADMPLFIDVVSIVSGYTLEGSVRLGGTVSSGSAVQGDFLNLGTQAKYTDRPTITYSPITGQQFNRSFMTPIPPRAILFLLQTGWSVDMIFPIAVDAINGLRAEVTAGANQRAGDPKYYQVIRVLREIQKSGAVGMQIKRKSRDDPSESTVMFIQREAIPPETRAALAEVRKLLGLKPDAWEITMRYGLIPRSDTEMALLTRSLLQIMITLATQIDVPPEHVAEGRTVASIASRGDGEGEPRPRIMDIRNSTERPADAFTAVNYRDRWFWIDDRDFNSKRTFAFLMILFSLMETGSTGGMPVITIPAG
jgi:hypothetical protein